MIRLIVTDIDGTLVSDGAGILNPEYYPVIKDLRSRGVQFAAASGRQWCSIERLFDPVKEKIFYISDNGAYVGCHGRNLFLHPIKRDTALELVREIRKIPGLEAMISGPDVVYLDTKNEKFIYWLQECYRFSVKKTDDLLLVDDDIIKVSAYTDGDIESAAKGLMNIFSDRLQMTISGTMWLDCMAAGVNKGEAVKLLQDSLFIKPEETIVFGDQLNDVEMLKRAYYSFAIGNARDEVKQTARFMADKNTENGVLKILKML